MIIGTVVNFFELIICPDVLDHRAKTKLPEIPAPLFILH